VAYIPTVQKDITPHMRAILVDWLVEVAQEYRVHDDTLFLTVAYLDRFLSARHCQRSKLQLLGVTCMLVAAKYEEIYAPQVVLPGICSTNMMCVCVCVCVCGWVVCV
jgi:cyclin-A